MEDELLKQLAIEVKQHPSDSPQRRRALSQLLSRLSRAKLRQPQRGKWTSPLYEQFLDEARAKTLLEVARTIDKYEPERGAVLAWVNNKLENRFKDVVQDFYRAGRTGISREDLQSGELPILSLDDLDREYPAQSTEPNLFRQFILEDLERRLTAHIKGRAKASMQFLLLARLDDQSWDEISAALGPPPISKQTLCSFFKRQLSTLTEYFQNSLGD